MSVIVYLIVLFFTGLVVGGLARLSLPGRDPMTIWETALVGVAGSFAAGLLVWLISGGRNGAGILLSVVCSSVIVYFIRRSRGGGLRDPGRPPEVRP